MDIDIDHPPITLIAGITEVHVDVPGHPSHTMTVAKVVPIRERPDAMADSTERFRVIVPVVGARSSLNDGYTIWTEVLPPMLDRQAAHQVAARMGIAIANLLIEQHKAVTEFGEEA
jgi:hypothetical protein